MVTTLRIVIFAAAGWLVLRVLRSACRSQIKPFGSPPIAIAAFYLAKLGMVLSISLLVLRAAVSPARLSPAAGIVFLSLLLGGTLVCVLGMSGLGRNLRVGLPEEDTALVTSGIYAYSRNPIYLGIYAVLAASLLYAFSWLNLLAVGIAVFLHHRIVLAEERFLSTRFDDYDAYRTRVRRYF